MERRGILFRVCLAVLVFGTAQSGHVQDGRSGAAAWWTFDGVRNGRVTDECSASGDEISGNFRLVCGVEGQAVKFDGYTTVVTRRAERSPRFSDALTVEAWVAVAAYPWNWCPVFIQETERRGGFALEIGPRGEVIFRVAAGGEKRECQAAEKIPGRIWVHLAGVYRKGEGLVLYVNGEVAGRTLFPDSDLLIGTVPEKRKAEAIHREFGTLPSWYSLDAILDEAKIYDRALTPDEVLKEYERGKNAAAPDIPARVLPSGPPGPDRFGAVYTRLSYYWEWDDLWRVAADPDVVVRFEGSPVRLVFWRGTRYSPAWVTENNLWMADQSLETWDDREGCFEHMQDPRCLYSHVRVIENKPARVVIDWRYAPVSAHNHLWNADPRTGWALWVDEYYYIYPDRTAVRKVSWQKGTLPQPVQFRESIPLTSPGQLQGDVINADYVTVGNLSGERQVFSYIPNPPKRATKPVPANPTIQIHNLKARNKPFIIFEPGSKMDYLRDMNIENLSQPGSCVHWPEGLIPCDGRTGLAADRAASFLGFPITDPVVYEGEESIGWVNSLYGTKDEPFDSLLPLARSWSRAPELRVISGEIVSEGYDMSQRAYLLKREASSRPAGAELEIAASASSPVKNFCLLINGWGENMVSLAVDGKAFTAGEGLRIGYLPTLSGTDLVVWVEKSSVRPVRVSLADLGPGDESRIPPL